MVIKSQQIPRLLFIAIKNIIFGVRDKYNMFHTPIMSLLLGGIVINKPILPHKNFVMTLDG